MANGENRSLNHIYLHNQGRRENFTWPNGGGAGFTLPVRNREDHAAKLDAALTDAITSAKTQIENRNEDIAGGVEGFYLEFEIGNEQAEALDKLEDMRGNEHIELLAVRPSESDPENSLSATVFVPNSKQGAYEKKLEQYKDSETPTGRPRNQPLIDSINDVRLASARSLFTDVDARFPGAGEQIWWEVWLRSDSRAVFDHAAEQLNIEYREHSVSFAEREIILAYATAEQLGTIVSNTDAIAELRLSQDTPAFFQMMDSHDQFEWSEELVGRLELPGANAPAVCLLDSGSTRVHPLIEPVLDVNDFHSWNAIWPPIDDSENWDGHGTRMSGLAIYGDLTQSLVTAESVPLSHILESVKILPDDGNNPPELYGHITTTAMTRAEIQAPERQRVFCLAITSDAERWFGKPSSWSASLDEMAYGNGEDQRLIAVSAGNVESVYPAEEYIDQNDTSPVEDPAQAWNVLTVGAFTENNTITDETFDGWVPVAPVGDISPMSRTSNAWKEQWPIKPEVVFEGGNYAAPPALNYISQIDDLMLLTTNNQLQKGYFNVVGDTSAASALAARMSAQILADNQSLWPETIRGLIVHSAEWTEAMRNHLPQSPNQSDKRRLLRRYGYGVPSFGRATRSAMHDVTLVIEDSIQPFVKSGSKIKTQDMNYHALPWPTATLEALGDSEVELQVTLSYYIEPNPGERGWTKKHRYASHGLRFAVKRSLESEANFRQRINAAAQGDAGAPNDSGNEDGWYFGPHLQKQGSIHSDTWTGTAAELAARGSLAIYPVGGWWREKKRLERYENRVRYSLVLTLRAIEGVDIYSEIVNSIEVEVEIEQ